MIWLIGVDCWSAKRVSGIADLGGPVYVNFLSKKGMLPLIDFDHPFKKADFKDIRHFVGVIGKFLPYTKFWNAPVRVKSLDSRFCEIGTFDVGPCSRTLIPCGFTPLLSC